MITVLQFNIRISIIYLVEIPRPLGSHENFLTASMFLSAEKEFPVKDFVPDRHLFSHFKVGFKT